jgi:hypothetical protein
MEIKVHKNEAVREGFCMLMHSVYLCALCQTERCLVENGIVEFGGNSG